MEKIKLGNFVELSNGSRYCIMNQQEIKGRYFALALTVPDKIDEIKNSEIRLLKVFVRESGKIAIREYDEEDADYHEIMDIFLTSIYPKNLSND